MSLTVLIACLVAYLPLICLAQTEGAFPSNTSAYGAPSQNSSLNIVLALPIASNGPHDPIIFALTSQAYNAVNHSPSSLSIIGNQVTLATPNSYLNLNSANTTVAFVDCDPSAYTGNIDVNLVLQGLAQQNVSAIVLYSQTAPFCNITTSPTPPANFQLYYTMTNVRDAQSVLSLLPNSGTGQPPAGGITTEVGYSNIQSAQSQINSGLGGPSPSTAVAMIILYSITGVITALFLIIIITGAIRAHRHPERYGPRNIIGRPRQSRAKGIARAMLDTIPIVKFGEQDQVKPDDVELGGEIVAADGTRSTEEGGEKELHEMSADSADREAGGAATTATGESANTAGEDNADSGLGCSICTEDFERGQDIRVLPCNHKFHPACVDPWLLDVSGTCPLCRVDLRPAEDREAEANESGTANGTSPENAPLPPPLDSSAPNRRHTIRNFFDLRRLQGSTREERLSALRRFRQAQGNSTTRTDEQGAAQVDESRLHRVRRSIFRN